MKVKFEQKTDPAFFGAEGWDDQEPFFAYATVDGHYLTIIVDSQGLSLNFYDDRTDSQWFYADWSDRSLQSARLAVKLIEYIELETFVEAFTKEFPRIDE
jgi:hypothetical protein